MSACRRFGATLRSVGLVLVLAVSRLEAGPVTVKLAEGNLRGFLLLRPLDGPPIGYGELRQHPRDGLIESRLVLNFKDGCRRRSHTATIRPSSGC
jgi:hypothetical protein